MTSRISLRLAITGATGFVGAETLKQALAKRFTVNALTRRPQPMRRGVRWITGALDNPTSLDVLMAGADAVIHVAGETNAPDRAAFERGNVLGTRNMIDAARRAGVRRFIHVSSLSAREPELSAYCWSKARAEQEVKASGLDWTIVRPPAVYGPGDIHMLDLFRAARYGVIPLPPGGNTSVIAVEDLARLLVALPPVGGDHLTAIYEVSDGKSGGWTHPDFARAIGRAVGRPVRPLPLPAWLMRLGARTDGLLRRGSAKLTLDRVSYFCHPDWVADPLKSPPPSFWQPEIGTEAGLLATAAGYRQRGWL